MSTEPTTVHFERVAAALDMLGIGDHKQVIAVTIDPRRVTVTRMRFDEQGRVLAAGDEIATVTTTVGIDYPKRWSEPRCICPQVDTTLPGQKPTSMPGRPDPLCGIHGKGQGA